MDLEKLNYITRGDSALMQKLLKVFIDQNQTDLKLLVESWEKQDAKKCYYFIHKINSAFKTICDPDAIGSFQTIEHKLHSGADLDEIQTDFSALIPKIKGQIESAKTHLSHLEA